MTLPLHKDKRMPNLPLEHLKLQVKALVRNLRHLRYPTKPDVVKIIDLPSFYVVGLSSLIRSYGSEKACLWEAFRLRLSEVRCPEETGVQFGVMRQNSEGLGIEYLAGVPVKCSSQLPADMLVWHFPARTYAVLETDAASVEQTFTLVYEQWLPFSGYRRAEGEELELYTKRFCMQHPTLWIYIPVQKK